MHGRTKDGGAHGIGLYANIANIKISKNSGKIIANIETVNEY